MTNNQSAAGASVALDDPRLTELGDGVFVYAVPGAIPVNAGIVVGAEAAAAIDTGTTEADARALLAAVARVTDRPLRYVVNTHHHGDHAFGNWWCLPAVIIGHERCRLRLIGEEGESHRELIARMLPAVADEVRAVPIVFPSITINQTLSIHLGDRTLRLDYLGRAHTDNDITIAAGDEVVFAGDLIEESGPPLVGDGYPAEWGATLRRLEVAGATRFVPGHGRPVDTAFVAKQARAFELLDDTCRAAESAVEAVATLPAEVSGVLGMQAAPAVERWYATVEAR